MLQSFLITIVFSFSLQASEGSIKLPVLLAATPQYEFYKQEDVCKYTREKAPDKKLALVVVKTHLCDGYTQVCLKSLANVSDKANTFIHDNFQVFHTRFSCQGDTCTIGETAIRNEWNKVGVDPKLIVIEPQSCKVLFRDFAYNWQGFYYTDKGYTSMDFEITYAAMKIMLLSKQSVRNILRIPDRTQLEDLRVFESEAKEINARLRSQYPQPSLKSVMDASVKQLEEFKLRPKVL